MPVDKATEDNRRIFYKILINHIHNNPENEIHVFYKGLKGILGFNENLKPIAIAESRFYSLNQFISTYAANRTHVGGNENAMARVELDIKELNKIPELNKLPFTSTDGYISFDIVCGQYLRLTRSSEYQKLKQITNESIELAIRRYNELEVPHNKKARKFIIKYKDKDYPAKYILKKAYQIRYPNSTNFDYFSSEDSTVQFLKDREFKCLIKDDKQEEPIVIENILIPESHSTRESNSENLVNPIDYLEKAIRDAELGNAGELLAIEFERKRLQQIGRIDLSEKVKKQPDSFGYDILSFDETGNEIFLEVKTTSGDFVTPFFLTINEKNFMEVHSANYFLYRIFNFNKELNNGNIEILSFEKIKKIKMEPKIFICSI